MRFRALVVLSLGILGGLTAACDSSTDGVVLVNQASSIAPLGRLSPNPIPFSPILGLGCPGGGLTFAPSFGLIVTAGLRDLTVDHATIHMIDGTNLGGPTVTIPQSAFTVQTSSVSILAGTTRQFIVHPNFGCSVTRPVALAGNVFLIDSQGMNVTIPVQGSVR